jgi:multidrug efflux pump subunit AcrB
MIYLAVIQILHNICGSSLPVVSCSPIEHALTCSEQDCDVSVADRDISCPLHLELSQIRSKEQYAVTALMSVEDRKRVVGNLNRAVLRCKTKHLDNGKHLDIQVKDRESKKRVRDSLTPEKNAVARFQNKEGMKRMRESETPEKNAVARFQNKEGMKRMRESETPEKKTVAQLQSKEGMKRMRDSETPEKRQIRLEIARNRKHETGCSSSVAREFEDELTRRRKNAVDGMSRRPRDLWVDLRGEESSDDSQLSDTHHGDYPSDVSSDSEESTDDKSAAKSTTKRKKRSRLIQLSWEYPSRSYYLLLVLRQWMRVLLSSHSIWRTAGGLRLRLKMHSRMSILTLYVFALIFLALCFL